MFTSHEQLVKRSGKKGVDRPQYLKELVEEFQTSENFGKLLVSTNLILGCGLGSCESFTLVE